MSDLRDRPVAGDLHARWPRVPRATDEELAQRASTGASLLLVGEAGIGKTALAASILAERRAAGSHVERLHGVEDQQDHTLGALRWDVPPPEELPSAQLLRWASGRLVERAAGAPLVIGVDDAQHLDPVSAALVHQMVATGAASAVVTVRAGTLIPDAIARLERDGVVRRSTLAPLQLDDVGSLLGEVLGAPVAASTVRTLTEASNGNPLHLRELCAHGLDRGMLRLHAGWWAWTGPIEAGAGLRRLLGERIAELDEASARGLDLVGFAGVLGMEVLEDLVGLDVIDALERRRLIVIERAGNRQEVRLTHPLFGEVVRASGRDRAASIHAVLADAVEACGARRVADLPRVAEWRLDAGRRVDPGQLLAAAEQASSSHHHVRAERLARAAVALGGGPMAEVTLGAVLAEADQPSQAEQVWAGIDDDARSPLTVQLHIVRSVNLFFGLDRAGAAAALLDDAAELATTSAELEQIAVKRGALELYGGRPAAARRAVASVHAQSSSPHRRGTAAVFLGPALALEARCDEGLAVVDGSLADGGGDASVNLTGELLAARFLVLVLAGRLADACDEARSVRELAARAGIQKGVAVFGVAEGHASLMLGRIDRAVVALEDAAVLLREHDRNRYLPWCLAELAHARVVGGDVAGAEDALREADRCRSAPFRFLESRLEIARSRWAAATDGPEPARDLALAAAERAVRDGQVVFAAHAIDQWARCGALEAGHHHERARAVGHRLAGAVHNPIVAACVGHLAAALDDDADALGAVAGAFADLGAALHAAGCLASASEASVRAGAPAAALGWALAARATAGSSSGTDVATLGALAALDVLSPRELEVARRTAEGTSSRALAEELYVSVRTVENHLHRVYAKLGVSGRDALAAALRAGAGAV